MFRDFCKFKLASILVILILIVAPFLIMVFYVEGSLVWPILLGTGHLILLLLGYFVYSNGLLVIEVQMMNQ